MTIEGKQEAEGYYRLREVADFISIAETLESIERGELLTCEEVQAAIETCDTVDPSVTKINLERRLAWMKKSGEFAVKNSPETSN